MPDDPDRPPSPVRRSTRERRQTVHQGAVSWDDEDLSEGIDTPDPESPGSDPDFQPRNQASRAGAARPGHRRQEAAAALQHYPPGIQDAQSPPGPAAMGDAAEQDLQCSICGELDHGHEKCPHYPDHIPCERCNEPGHLAQDCQATSPARDRQSLSELSNLVSPAPRDYLQ